MNTIEFLPIPIPEAVPEAVGLGNGYPIGMGINRLLRWWKVKTWKLLVNFQAASVEDNPQTYTVTQDFNFLNHTITDRPTKLGFVPTSLNDLFVRRETDLLVTTGPATTSVKFFVGSIDPVFRVGSLFYPRFDIKYQFEIPVGPHAGTTAQLDLSIEERLDTRVFLSVDNQRLSGFGSSSTTVLWIGGTVKLEIVDFWY